MSMVTMPRRQASRCECAMVTAAKAQPTAQTQPSLRRPAWSCMKGFTTRQRLKTSSARTRRMVRNSQQTGEMSITSSSISRA